MCTLFVAFVGVLPPRSTGRVATIWRRCRSVDDVDDSAGVHVDHADATFGAGVVEVVPGPIGVADIQQASGDIEAHFVRLGHYLDRIEVSVWASKNATVNQDDLVHRWLRTEVRAAVSGLVHPPTVRATGVGSPSPKL